MYREGGRYDPRAQALAKISATEAGRDPEVQSFRREVLRGRLVKLDRVPAWIAKRAAADGPPTEYVTAPVGPDRKPIIPPRAEVICRHQEGEDVDLLPKWTYLEISHRVRGEKENPLAWPIERTRVAAQGALGRLRRIAAKLETRWGWPAWQCVDFVLSGEAPAPFMYTIELPLDFDRNGMSSEQERRIEEGLLPPYASRFITLRLRPLMLPAKVAEVYAEARRSVRNPGGKQVLSDKHAELAVFAHARNDGRSWTDAFEEWNASHPDWGYTRVEHFGRDARLAFERITGRPLRWKRRQGERSGA